ncbi:MAG TPA: winged helix-turn-helix domain-containing protein [Candidatus Tectomicrobia bacterium]
MGTEIGEAAGRIWQYLAEHGETTLRQLQRGTRLPERLLHMGIGWLAREDKLCFVQERGIVKLALHTQLAPG